VTAPGLFDAVIGQEQAVTKLREAIAAPVHAYLLAGPPGSGKREAARAFAAALLCRQGGDGTCRDCRLALAGEHPDVREVERAAAAISMEQAREITTLASRTPVEGDRKVLILHEFHLLRDEAAAALLKTIEEPPASTVFVILADDVPPELITIASRCSRIDFRPVPHDLVVAALVESGVEPDAAALAADAATGNLDRARLLAHDPGLAARRDAFHRLPGRLDGNGTTVVAATDELLGLIDGAAQPLKERHAVEVVELDRRSAQVGERRGDRKDMEDRHKRELRRHRTDELKAGLVSLASAYRDRLADGTLHDPASGVIAVRTVHEAIEAIDRNPNERLLLEALLLRLPPV
jgi:DNA polymerase III subunit delta'